MAERLEQGPRGARGLDTPGASAAGDAALVGQATIGASAQGQGAEILAAAAANAQAMRGRTLNAAHQVGQAFADEAAAQMQPISGVLPTSGWALWAERMGEGGALAEWGATYDGGRPWAQAVARAGGRLQVYQARGVDWTDPNAHADEVAALSGDIAAPEVQQARAAQSDQAQVGLLDEWRIALAEADGARHGMRQAQAAAEHRLLAQRQAAKEDQVGRLKAEEGRLNNALKIVFDLGNVAVSAVASPPKAVVDGVRLGLNMAKAIPWSNIGVRQHRAAVSRLNAAITALKAQGQVAAIQEVTEGLSAARDRYAAALRRVDVAEARLLAAQADTARQRAALGVALDEQHSPGDGPAVTTPTPDASDRGVVLMGVLSDVEALEASVRGLLTQLVNTAGPRLIDRIYTEITQAAATRAGSALDPTYGLHGDGDRLVGDAAMRHLGLRDSAATHLDTVIRPNADAWRRLTAPLTGATPKEPSR